MIFDEIVNLDYYLDEEMLQLITSELANFDINSKEGLYKSKKESLYYKIVSYKTAKNPEIIESHLKEIDLQIILKGHEYIDVYSKKDLTPRSEYDKNTDCIFYKQPNSEGLRILLKPGNFALFTPNDVHRCQISVDSGSVELKKIVIKIDEKLFKRK